MKKILLLMLAFATSVVVKAQNYPGEKVELLKDKQLKVLPVAENLQKYGYHDFYTDDKLKKKYKEEGTATKYNALIGKVFKVVSYEPYKNSIGTTKYKLKLENAETGTLYFDYDPKYDSNYKFEVIGGLTFPEGFFCERAVEKESPNEDLRKYEFPFINGVMMSYSRSDKFEYMILQVNCPTSETFAKDAILRGVTLTFENGKTINLTDEKLTHSSNGAGGSVVTAIFGFLPGKNDKEIELLKSSKLVSIKLNKAERPFTDGFTFLEYVKCAIK